MTLARLAAAAFLAASATGAHAAEAGVAAIHAWSRPAAAGSNGVGYLTLVNHGKADALVAADSPLAQRVELHASSMAGGVMRMAAEPSTPLPAHGQVSFAPGGRHLMFVGLKRALHVGDQVPATLRFQSGLRLHVKFAVAAGAPEAPMAPMAPMPGMR
ncbi:MAG: hypothetical protein JWQ97_3087 [Phenylobacterium sp.]|nr:hypothetical protein [Phenylobacterium sp.]